MNDTTLTNNSSITVLLIDDQAMVGEAVRRMLMDESDIDFHFCSNPEEAIPKAETIHPTVILQDLVMPDMDGLTLVKFMRAHPALQDVPLIVLSVKEDPRVKAEAFALGANDYLVKLPDAIELIARIRYHSQAYINRIQREEAFRALQESQEHLASELSEAAVYVRSLIPKPVTGPVSTEWKFIPSMDLGGDSFGYHWIDDDHFALFLLDVSGHGVGAALLSVSAMNTLRAQTLPNTDFHNPDDVLNALNQYFPVLSQNGMFFTIWYGVYQVSTRTLKYSSAGHPPALLVREGNQNVEELTGRGLILGITTNYTYSREEIQIGQNDCLYLYSDGVYEIKQADGELWTLKGFIDLISRFDASHPSALESIVEQINQLNSESTFEDDFSLVRFCFRNE